MREGLLKRFLNFITFVDLPLKKKFILFSAGVLFWLIVMFTVSITSNLYIKDSTSAILHNIIPTEHVAQKVTRKFQKVNIAVQKLAGSTSAEEHDKLVGYSEILLSDIQAFLITLLNGGQLTDIDRDNETLIESIYIDPDNDSSVAKKYITALTTTATEITKSLKTVKTYGSSSLGVSGTDNAMIATLKKLSDDLTEAAALSTEFTTQTAKLSAFRADKISTITGINHYTLLTVLIIALILLIIFTTSISDAIRHPVKAITRQINAYREGDITPSSKLPVRSKDEMGDLLTNFNDLMEEIHSLANFKKVIEEDDTLDDVYSRLGSVFSSMLGLKDFIIYEVSSVKNEMTPVYPAGASETEIFCNDEILHKADICKVKKTGHTISSIAFPGVCRQFCHEEDKVHICMPMIIGGKTGCVVQFLFQREQAGKYDINKRLFKAEQYIKESLSVIQAKRLMNQLRESAMRDSLTGLYNRRFLQDYAETLVAGILRREKSIGIIMCDLDFFKQVNDMYGHNVGDIVLQKAADIIKLCVRASDLIIRFGGEEFMVIMLDINEGDTLRVAEKIRESIERNKISVSDGSITKTISLGVSEFPKDTDNFWQAIEYADAALYL
ncbi:MAG: sensor domain-containing diguanylate cyclase, partial [Nitrospira sp.]|nr:sensor domain-containing diguanylate cyclase [Nitrospira sp.]